MGTYTYKGKSAYIDDRLQKDLDENIIPELQDKDADCVLGIDGGEGTGKSKLSDSICGYVALKLRVDYSVSNVHLNPHTFRDAIIKAKKNDIIVYDEAHKGMGSRRSLSEINNILNDLMMEMRQKNLFVVLILPTFFMLDKYPAIFRTRGLFHVYRGKNQQTGKRERGFWCYFNKKYKLLLYIRGKQYFNYNCIEWPNYRGRFYDQWIMDKKEYTIKKYLAFKQHGKKETKAEVYLSQRNKIIYALYKKMGVGVPTLTKTLNEHGIKLSQTMIQKILIETEIKLKNNDKNDERLEEFSNEEEQNEDSIDEK
jgi:hypothetical protein